MWAFWSFGTSSIKYDLFLDIWFISYITDGSTDADSDVLILTSCVPRYVSWPVGDHVICYNKLYSFLPPELRYSIFVETENMGVTVASKVVQLGGHFHFQGDNII